jgi:putative endonuclease
MKLDLESFYYTYVLLSSKDDKFYIGFTNNLGRRIAEHKSGKNISTAKRLPLELIYFEGHKSRVDAERREKYFKTTKGKVTLRQILRESIKPK